MEGNKTLELAFRCCCPSLYTYRLTPAISLMQDKLTAKRPLGQGWTHDDPFGAFLNLQHLCNLSASAGVLMQVVKE